MGAIGFVLFAVAVIAGVSALLEYLNAEMEHQTARDSTKGTPRPLGQRGARLADTVGEAHA